MPHKLKVATVQMDAAPVPTSERLERAADLVAEAAGTGAKIVALPEVFNTGYVYADENFARSEPLDGETVTWMRVQAEQHQIYLAGSLMLRDDPHVYNSALLVAPAGRIWRYDKRYPFAWERIYFRDGHGITIADTEHGKIGMMICWDSAHAHLWREYAGQVELMLIISSPPKLSSLDLVLPDAARVNARELGGLWDVIYTDEEYFPGVDMEAQTAWLNVPVVASQAGGHFRSYMPLPQFSFMNYASARPDLWKWLPQAEGVLIETGFDPQCKILDASGHVLARVEAEGDGFTAAEVTLPDTPPHPNTIQPEMHTAPLAYLLTDHFGSQIATFLYRRGLRRHFGAHMAPLDEATQIKAGLGLLLFGVLLGWLMGRRHYSTCPTTTPR